MNAIASIELPETVPGVTNRVVPLEDARNEIQPAGVKFWLNRDDAYQYAEVSATTLKVMEFRGRIETCRVLLSRDHKQARLFVSRDSLDAYKVNFGREVLK